MFETEIDVLKSLKSTHRGEKQKEKRKKERKEALDSEKEWRDAEGG